MNGFGVAAAVAVGIEIVALVMTPELTFDQVLILMLFHGAVIGFAFQLWKMALDGVHLPFSRR